jgi:hypothetical protein
MIKGGTSAAGKTGALMTGYTQYYQPCEVICFSIDTQAAMEASRGNIGCTAFITIEDLSGNLVTLTSCSYFQVQRYIGDGIDNATLTIEKPEVWSIWGSSYTELLKPSKRTVTIFSGLAGKEVIIFKGRITGMVEITAGGGTGAINLYLSDHRATLQRIAPLQMTYEHTRYCEVHRLSFQTMVNAGANVTIYDKDVIGLFAPADNNFNSVNQAMSGSAEWASGAIMNIGNAISRDIIGEDLFYIDDSIITYATRDFYDSSAYNTTEIMGLKSGFVITKTIRDDADIAKRGKIMAGTVLGTEYDNLDDIETLARALLAKSLAGRFSISIKYNPYLIPGQIIIVKSDKYNIPESYAKLNMVRQQYSYENQSTALDGVEVLP